MEPSRPFALRPIALPAAAGALVLVLTASKCEQTTAIIPYVKEICTDQIDNDEDGKTDCADSECDLDCAVSVSIDPIPVRISTDTLDIKGHHVHATAVTVVSLSPSGTPGTATVSGDAWTARLTNLSQSANYTVTVVASNGDRKDTAVATFTRGN